MAYVTIAEARGAFQRSRAFRAQSRSARDIIAESARQPDSRRFDVFLSHCMKDCDAIAGVKEMLEEAELSVYIDWLEDKELSRAHVTKQTAEKIRQRMVSSETLMFVTSETSPSSKWMPWELGYFDGFRQGGRIAVFPLVAASTSPFDGQEYVGLYPKVERLRRKDGTSALYVTNGPNTYMTLNNFKAGATEFLAY